VEKSRPRPRISNDQYWTFQWFSDPWKHNVIQQSSNTYKHPDEDNENSGQNRCDPRSERFTYDKVNSENAFECQIIPIRSPTKGQSIVSFCEKYDHKENYLTD